MTAVATVGTASGSSAGGRGRAYVAIVVVVAIVVAIVALALIAPSRRTDGDPLDPTSTSATGTKAAVELARRLGADVSITSELPDSRTQVAVLFEDLVTEDQASEVKAWVAAGHTLVVTDPYSSLTPLAEIGTAGPITDQVTIDRGRCDAEVPAGLAELRQLAIIGAFGTFETSPGETSCFTDGGGAVVVVESIGSGRLISVGSGSFFTNELLDQADNAGLWAALAVPEHGTRLDILVAGVDGSGLQPSDSGDLSLPTGVALGLLQLLVAFVVYCLYRARRLGKPVPEDPPVVIAGSELTRAVGGLLEHAGARDRAAASLRRSARRRLAAAFGLPVGADPTAVVATVADRTALDRMRLDAALLDAPVADDAALATLARELDDVVAVALGPTPSARGADPTPLFHRPFRRPLVTDPSSAGPPPPDAAPPASPAAPAADAHAAITRLRAEVAKVIVGQEGTVSGIVVALLVRGHVLLEGVPGTAKTLLVKTVAAALDLETRRVQFTPDLMPSDLTGQVVYRQADATFMFRQGPVFTNLLLADEVNRTPPKTQAALLEAMEERQVSVEGTTHLLPDPFLVIATQNPVEYEGTYPLPEAQLDRFLFKLDVGYPSAAEELDVLARHDRGLDPHDIVGAGVRPVASVADLAFARSAVDQLRAEQPVLEYIVAVVRATRESPSLSLGVSPRGATALLHAAKAWAWLSGRDYVTPDEVKAVAKPTLRHRLMVRPELELEGVTPDGVLDGVLATVPVPR